MVRQLTLCLVILLQCSLFCDELYTSRFILPSDPKARTVAGSPPVHPQEYMWAAQFAGPNDVVLDAACGVSEPFKWFLGKTCKETWAIDNDPRIADFDKLVKATKDDLGDKASRLVVKDTSRWKNNHLVEGSICHLPSYLPKFDRIFCIATFHLLSQQDQKTVLNEFSKALAPNGLVLFTINYQEINPQEFLKLALDANLIPAGTVDFENPISNIYRCVLKHNNLQIIPCN